MLVWMKRLFWLIVVSLFFAVGATCSVLIMLWLQGPPNVQLDENTVIFSQHHTVLAEHHGIESRYAVELEDVSQHVRDAFIAAEDHHFYNHAGFNPKRIAGAAYQNIVAQERAQGASTITQQLARNLFLSHDKTWNRKIKELLIALRLEMFWSKDTILTSYLNTIYFGHGQYGIESASRFYFDKHADELKVSEAALLAAIPKGPAVYSPIDHQDRAKERQTWILQQMKQLDVIDDDTYAQASDEPIRLVTQASTERETGQYAVQFALEEAASILGLSPEQVTASGYQIHTTIDETAQNLLEEKTLDHFPEEDPLQIGAMTLNHESGAIVAMQGGRDFTDSRYNRAVQAERMTGSTFKAFLYYAALVYGFTPSTTLESTATQFPLANGDVYQPANVSDVYADRPVTLAQALAVSDNIYAVKTNQMIGPENLAEAADVFGIDVEVEPGLALALGTESASVYEMTRAYGLLANRGQSVDPYIIDKIENRDGDVVYEHEPSQQETVLDERYAFVLTHLLTGMFDERLSDYLRVTGAPISHQLNQAYAGKSGTTDFDAWMVGYSPHYTTAVWTGYDDNQALSTRSESQAAKTIWADYMHELHANLPVRPFTVPHGVNGVDVDPNSGRLASDACSERARTMYFIEGTEPTTYCEDAS
ncbi:1A family penicillin-binding protein [Alkalibacillus flavidus]|uniref:1A family penicillin-binding protein n=1 Tax=Alkalibacillus flavidus TaxID=546021 RepID=A0ABV2KX68_9BACI